MNPLTNVKNITKLNETELATGSIHKKSWHDMYKDSAWIFFGGLDYGLTEGDVLAVFSQYGEIVNINLVRDKKTGKSKGFGFLCFANQKSTVLSVDNFNGIKLCNRTIRVDHVSNYKPPKENDRDDEITKMLKSDGCAPHIVEKKKISEESGAKSKKKKSKKEKKEKKSKPDSSNADKGPPFAKDVKVKKEKHDPSYDKYDTSNGSHGTTSTDLAKASCSYKIRRLKEALHQARVRVKQESDSDSYSGGVKVKKEQESDSDTPQSSSKRHKRRISGSSSEGPANNHREYNRKSRDNVDDLNRRPDNKRQWYPRDCSSSSDDSSSTQSSTDDERHHSTKKHSKSKNTQHAKKRSVQEHSRDKSYHKSKNSHSPDKRKTNNHVRKLSEHKSKTRHDSDDARNSSNSHKKSK